MALGLVVYQFHCHYLGGRVFYRWIGARSPILPLVGVLTYLKGVGGCWCGGRGGRCGGLCSRGSRCEAAHVLFERTVIAECIVSSGGELAEPAIEAGWRAVALNGSVWAAAVCRPVFRFGVSAGTTYSAASVLSRPGACVGVVCK